MKYRVVAAARRWSRSRSFGPGRSIAAIAPPRVSISPAQLVADGYDTATLTIDEASPVAPRITIETPHAASRAGDRRDRGRLAGANPCRRDAGRSSRCASNSPVARRRASQFTTTLDTADSAQDGTPDFLRLDDADDQRAFRRWFTFLAETQFFQPREARPAEIVDCAALIRYAYREALRAHDGRWATDAHLPLAPGIASPAKYQYPFTPLGADLFRVQPGRFAARGSGIAAPSRNSPTPRRCSCGTPISSLATWRARSPAICSSTARSPATCRSTA